MSEGQHQLLTPGAAGVFVRILFERRVVDERLRDAIYLALIDIAESVSNIYARIIPSIIGAHDMEAEILEDKLFDLREEFRHIAYHIHDAEFDQL